MRPGKNISNAEIISFLSRYYNAHTTIQKSGSVFINVFEKSLMLTKAVFI